MRELIITGKTVEEATEKACLELGVNEADINVEILELPQRKLFKSIPAKIKATVEDEEETVATAPVSQPAPAPQKEEKAQPVAKKEELQENETAVSEDNAQKAKLACEYLQDLAQKMNAANVTIEPVQQGDSIVLKVNGEDAGALIGHRGEVMESLSYLCGLVANRTAGEYTRVNLDVNNYCSKRESNLTALATRIAQKVAKTGRSHTLEPMNPYERRIIHSAVSEVEGVVSESTGEGINRRVVISSKNPRTYRDNKGGNRGNFRGNNKPNQRGGYNKPNRDATPRREFADKPRNTSDAPSVPVRTEKVNDGADLPLYGKIEL